MANRLINPITGTPVISYNEAALFFMATRIHYSMKADNKLYAEIKQACEKARQAITAAGPAGPPPLDELVDEWMFKLDVEKAVMEQEKAKQEAAEA
ncbi:hypothetical protein HBI56_059770 [Parastagonospora nodorum]|uniref:Uncharacterized protein n=2 Tax=Phaeosphaeria nodorum (strain SN15 / ATCC MYA-4574 / FGSC 10173) TaxID=321614 RepID=A0A7U2F2B9_PHANO|nr:hypothetical protein SNOG_08866 [Parastagonospora nodorum SN15]KAH3909617.1 hypothetical protein HBH56_158840 [Parastagonospora nodorum]EAT84034.2 hypothetical protein SNOG_08866 [Parastagonospora nodorum SN15]KAH3922483.1 hypothetical protein HBH54_223270 [Parastagonospora nodorum]KAH3946907.1 hypothetical protein HBH53_123070 [Parastagonospora nodorum]KAH3969780.1 hypothetical protein HBH52_171080 [Parastagonospora nodorum]